VVHAVAHRHLGQHDEHRQAELIEGADEPFLEVLEAPVHAPDAVPGHVDLLADRLAAALPDRLGELLDDLVVVVAQLEPAGVDDAEGTALVQVQVGADGHRGSDAGDGHGFAEDGIDQGGLAHPGLAEHRQVDAADLVGLLLELGAEALREPLRHVDHPNHRHGGGHEAHP